MVQDVLFLLHSKICVFGGLHCVDCV